VHAVARQIDRSPGRVSEILSELRSQGVVGSDNRPFVPELFWAVAEEWKPVGIRCLKLHRPTHPSGSD